MESCWASEPSQRALLGDIQARLERIMATAHEEPNLQQECVETHVFETDDYNSLDMTGIEKNCVWLVVDVMERCVGITSSVHVSTAYTCVFHVELYYDYSLWLMMCTVALCANWTDYIYKFAMINFGPITAGPIFYTFDC